MRFELLRRAVLLFVLFAFAAPGAPARADDPAPPPPSWRDQAQAAYAEKDWPEAIFLYRKWLEADPQDETSWYNLACTLALAGHADAALDAFESAVAAGWKDAEWPKADPDLVSIRDHARFEAALAAAASRADADAPEGAVRHWVPIPALGTYIAMLPPGYEKSEARYPLVVILHGHGSSENGHGRLADRALGREGVIYIAPRAPYPHEGVFTNLGRPGWTWRPEGAQEADLAGLDPAGRYVDSILAAVDDAKRRYRVLGDRVYVVGHSMGAFFANTLAILHPERVAAYYAYAGGIPEDQRDPEKLKALAAAGVRAYLAHGRTDPVVPVSETETAHELLHAAGVQVVTRIFDDQDHGVGDFVALDMGDWIRDVVRGLAVPAFSVEEAPR